MDVVTKTFQNIIERTKEREGEELKPYRCTAGKLTIGYGRNIEDNGITVEEAEFLLCNDIQNAMGSLEKIFGRRNLPALIVEAFTDMIINMGETRFRGFVNMIEAAMANNWATTANEAMDSKWFREHEKRGSTRALEVLGLIHRAGK